MQKVNRELVRAMNQPEAQQRLRQDGLLSQPMSPDELGRFIAAETARWKPVVERAGLLQRFH